MKNAAFLAVTLFLLIFSSGCLIADLDEDVMRELMEKYSNESNIISFENTTNESIYVGKTNKRAPPPLPEQ